jgi:LemA protein
MKIKPAVLALIAGLVGIPVLALLWGVGVNNTLVSMEEGVNAQKAQVESVYQRRADLIPNLVSTVQGYAKHEATVLKEVTQARASVGQVRLANTGDAQDLARFEKAQGQLSSALSRLLVVAERYPDLKANTNFRDLQSQLEGTENRITIERQRFNEACRDFNSYARRFPQSLIAGLRGFKEKAYFAAQAGAENAPRVEF